MEEKIMNKFKLAIVGAAALLSACVIESDKSAQKAKEVPYSFAEFSDVPIPEDATMVLDKTSIYGRDNDWVGTVTFNAPYNVGGTFDFYMSELPKFGWGEITSVRGGSSVLVFTRDRRVVLIQIITSSFESSVVTITMSPAPRSMRDAKRNARRLRRQMEESGQPVPNNGGTPVNPAYNSDPSKQAPGSLGLGDASNLNYPSNSPGVGRPVM
jgi:hypothetical protein